MVLGALGTKGMSCVLMQPTNHLIGPCYGSEFVFLYTFEAKDISGIYLPSRSSFLAGVLLTNTMYLPTC